MNPKQSQLAYLNWLKRESPGTYLQAVRRAMSAQGLGSLGDDLIASVGMSDASFSAADIGDASQAIGNASGSLDTSSWGSLFSNIANAVSQIAPTIVQSKAQLATIQLNAQRAAAGQSLIGANSLFTGQGMSSISPTMMLLGVAVLGGVLILSSKRHA